MSPLLNGRVLAHYCNSALAHYHEVFVCEVQWSRAGQLALPQLIYSAICLHFNTASRHYFTSLRGSKVVFLFLWEGHAVCECVCCTCCQGAFVSTL